MTSARNLTLALRCTPSPEPDPFGSVFTMEFTPLTGGASIQHRWQYGDLEGTHSRRYRTHALYTMPLFCLNNSTRASFRSPRSTTPSTCHRPPALASPACSVRLGHDYRSILSLSSEQNQCTECLLRVCGPFMTVGCYILFARSSF
jgi:hypothetical protein